MTVHIALCPIHGLHGQRQECFVCGGPVEQVPMTQDEQQPDVTAFLEGARSDTGAPLRGDITLGQVINRRAKRLYDAAFECTQSMTDAEIHAFVSAVLREVHGDRP